MLRSVFLVGIVASALIAGCANDTGDTTILILHNEFPQSGCVTTADTTAASLSAGRYDLGFFRQSGLTSVDFGYLFTPVVQNDSTADLTNQGAIARRTFIAQGAHVDITFNDTNGLSQADQDQLTAMGFTHFDARFGGAVMPNGALSTFAFEIVPAGIMDAVLAKYPPQEVGPGYTRFPDIGMIVTIVLYGNMNGGTIESAQFAYPVTVCDGCITNYIGDCSTVATTFMPRSGGACFLNQDGIVDCCSVPTTSGTTLVCPAVGTSMP